MDKCKARKKAVKGFFHRNAYWVMVPTLIFGLAILWGIWGFGGGQFFLDALCKNDEKCEILGKLASLGDVFGGINALFAGLALAAVAVSTDLARRAFTAERQWVRDEKYTEQVVASYKWAFDVLTDQGQSIPPMSDRVKWLVTARHLLRAEKISQSISTPELKTILEEQKEFWRHQFHLALDYPELRTKTYFSGAPKEHSPIYPTSALVIVDFSTWKKTDPIDEVDEKPLRASLYEGGGNVKFGLRAYLESKNVKS